MKQVTNVLLIFLPLVTTSIDEDCACCKTDSMENYPPNPQDDRTEYEINAITELLQLFDKEKMKNDFDEWILQNQTFDMLSIILNNSKKITFTKFLANEDIVPISSLSYISGDFNSHLWFNFKTETKVIPVNANLELLRSGNYSTCHILFNFHSTRVEFKFNNINNSIRNIKEIEYFKTPEIRNLISNVELDEDSCKSIMDEERRPQFIFEDILKATEIAVEERAKLIIKSVFQSIADKWIHPVKNAHALRETKYSRFELNSNDDTFPWPIDHNEYIIKGLQNFYYLAMDYSFNGETSYLLSSKDVKISWNIALLTMMRFSFDIGKFVMRGALNEIILMEDLTLQLDDVLEVGDHDYTTEIDSILIANGITQTVQKIRCDGTTDVINVIQEIFRLFDEKLFEKTLLDLEKLEETIIHFGTISGFKLDIEAIHLENMTRLHSDKLEVSGTLKYEKIKGQAKVFITNGMPVSIILFIKEATIRISLKHSNTQNDTEIQHNTSWSYADTTIMITSNYHHLLRQTRIEIGQKLISYFNKLMENQIINVAKSTLRPVFDIYKNSFDSSILKAGPSNHFDNQRQCIALIHDYWSDTTESGLTHAQAVEVIIEGFWNFDLINVHYVHGKLSIGDLQLKNVKASITQANNLNDSVTTDYTMSHSSLTINHTENVVFAKVSLPDRYPTNIMEKLESTVARYIGYLLYGKSTKNSNYRVNVRNFFDETTTKIISEDVESANYSSSQFTSNIINSLKDEEPSFYTFHSTVNTLEAFSNSDHILSETTSEFVDSFLEGNIRTTSSMMQEEICVYSNNSQSTNNIVEHLVVNGTIELIGDKIYQTVIFNVPFAISSTHMMNAIDDRKNESRSAHIYIDNKNITAVSVYGLRDYDLISDETLKTAFSQLANYSLRNHLEKIPFFCNFSRPAFDSSIPPYEYFFAIKNTVKYPSLYYIKLYGTHNFKMLRRKMYSPSERDVEISIMNMTARIIWNYYIDDYIWRMPKIMNLQIREITLCAKIIPPGRLIFTKQSRLQLVSSENSKMVRALEEKLETIVLKGIEQEILQDYATKR